MAHDLHAALCLVLVTGGLVLLAAPRGWQRMARATLELELRALRLAGAGAVAAGLLVPQRVRRA